MRYYCKNTAYGCEDLYTFYMFSIILTLLNLPPIVNVKVMIINILYAAHPRPDQCSQGGMALSVSKINQDLFIFISHVCAVRFHM